MGRTIHDRLLRDHSQHRLSLSKNLMIGHQMGSKSEGFDGTVDTQALRVTNGDQTKTMVSMGPCKLVREWVHWCLYTFPRICYRLFRRVLNSPLSGDSAYYTVSGTPPSALSSHTILAVLQPEGEDERIRPNETLFAKLGYCATWRSKSRRVRRTSALRRVLPRMHGMC